MERSNSGDWKMIFKTNSSTLNIGLMMYGRTKWQEVEATSKDFNIVLIRQDKKFFTFELSKVIQEAIPLILSIPDNFSEYIYHVGCAVNLHSITNSGLIPGGQHSGRDRQTVFLQPWILCKRTIKTQESLIWPNHVLHLTSKTGKCTKIRRTGSIFSLLNGKDSSSIKQNRTQSSCTVHSQRIVSRKQLWWNLKKYQKVYVDPENSANISTEHWQQGTNKAKFWAVRRSGARPVDGPRPAEGPAQGGLARARGPGEGGEGRCIAASSLSVPVTQRLWDLKSLPFPSLRSIQKKKVDLGTTPLPFLGKKSIMEPVLKTSCVFCSTSPAWNRGFERFQQHKAKNQQKNSAKIHLCFPMGRGSNLKVGFTRNWMDESVPYWRMSSVCVQTWFFPFKFASTSENITKRTRFDCHTQTKSHFRACPKRSFTTKRRNAPLTRNWEHGTCNAKNSFFDANPNEKKSPSQVTWTKTNFRCRTRSQLRASWPPPIRKFTREERKPEQWSPHPSLLNLWRWTFGLCFRPGDLATKLSCLVRRKTTNIALPRWHIWRPCCPIESK